MFKSGKPTKPTRKPGGGAALMQQMGFQMPNMSGGMDEDDDDVDLEAELRQLQGFSGNGRKPNGDPAVNLQAFQNDVNKLLRDIDRPMNDDDPLSDVDEDDLMAELNELTEEYNAQSHPAAAPAPPPKASPQDLLTLLNQRQDMYMKAIAAAKAANDSSKTRRLERQLKTIQELIQTGRSGGMINESDIPPEVFVPSSTPASAPVPAPAPPPPPPTVQPRTIPQPVPIPRAIPPAPAPAPMPKPTNNTTDPAIERLKALALKAKQQGDMVKAKEYIIQLRTLQSGTSAPPVQNETYDNVPEVPPPQLPLKAPEPKTVMEALEQRLEELTKRGEEAARSGDQAKARRMERMSKQYEEAIRATRKGLAYNYNELPEMAGFAPIPVNTAQSAAPVSPQTSVQARSSQPRPAPQQATTTVNTGLAVRKNQQAQTLRLKQEKFYKLAAQAKQKGDMETAKKFLIAYRGLDPMIEAAENGRPIDMSQVPKLPDDEGDLIADDDLTQDLATADRETIFRRLQDDLIRQIQICARNQQTYSQMDEADAQHHAQEYKQLEQRCSKDLEKLRSAFQRGAKPPLFHYERKQLTIVQINHDLGENDLEVMVLRGINLPCPSGQSASSLETYVMIEFPYPTEEPQTARTRHAVGSGNAEYPESQHKFYIKRNDAKFRRLMNRKELKLVVCYKPGFLRSDRPLGIASIKLALLEQQCTIHESADLFEVEHKKKIEGKLEVKIRIREALTQNRASDILPQRWLVIDRFEESHSSKTPIATASSKLAPAISTIACLVPKGDTLGQIALQIAETSSNRRSQQPVPVSNPQSIQVLNYEASSLKHQINDLGDRLTSEQLHQLEGKLRSIEEESNRIARALRRGGKAALDEHVRGLEDLVEHYDQEAREYHQRRDQKKADLFLTKKKLVLKEIETLTGRAPVSTTRL